MAQSPLNRAEDLTLAAALSAMALLPLSETALRALFGIGVPGVQRLLQHLTLVVCMLGAAVAARENRLLSLSALQTALRGRSLDVARAFCAAATAAVSALLCAASIQFALSERAAGTGILPGLPAWIVQLVMPLGFAAVATYTLYGAGKRWPARTGAALLAAALILIVLYAGLPRSVLVTAGLVVLAAAAILGAPVFVALGGAGLLLFWGDELPIAALAVDHYRLVVNAALPTIPLFTLAGYLLAESKSPQRLIRVFDALLGPYRGGAAAVAILAGAFFSAFTGASGVTILALGGLLLPLLIGVGQSQRTAMGLITSSSALGVLLPPSLPLILFAIVAQVPIKELFLGALLPGLLLSMLLLAWGWRNAPRPARQSRESGELTRALVDAKWELALPIVAFAALFGGFATPVEAAALTALYAFVITVLVHKDLLFWKDAPRVMAECGLVVGGVLLILGVALGFTNYLIDAQIPDRLLEWTTANVQSRWMFLALLNVVLLLVGCLMDVFSAIVVVVPIIVPVAAAFGVDPVHLGIIFLANMELGFLTPPVGMNLFFASYRFGRPVMEVARAVLPFLAILAVGVLLITYMPWLTTTLPKLVH